MRKKQHKNVCTHTHTLYILWVSVSVQPNQWGSSWQWRWAHRPEDCPLHLLYLFPGTQMDPETHSLLSVTWNSQSCSFPFPSFFLISCLSTLCSSFVLLLPLPFPFYSLIASYIFHSISLPSLVLLFLFSSISIPFSYSQFDFSSFPFLQFPLPLFHSIHPFSFISFLLSFPCIPCLTFHPFSFLYPTNQPTNHPLFYLGELHSSEVLVQCWERTQTMF